MRRAVKKVYGFIVLALTCLAMSIFAVACSEPPAPPAPPEPPVKVSDGTAFSLAVGADKNIVVADHITANGNTVTAATSDAQKATAAVADGLLTVTGVGEGAAVVTLKCEDISVTFDVTVYVTYTVSVDGKVTTVTKGDKFKLPVAPVITDPDIEFIDWLVGTEHLAPGTDITVNDNIVVTAHKERKDAVKKDDIPAQDVKLTLTNSVDIATYITTHGNDVVAASADEGIALASVSAGKIVITPVAEGNTTVNVECGNLHLSFAVTVLPAPVVTYEVSVDGNIIELSSGSTYTLPAGPVVSDPDYEFKGWMVNGDSSDLKSEGDTVTVSGNITVVSVIEQKAAVKVADIPAQTIPLDSVVRLDIATYITTHGRTVGVESDDTGIVTAAIESRKIVLTPIAKGNATVTVTCGDVTIDVAVSVVAPINCTVTVDGGDPETVTAGSTYTLPAQPASYSPTDSDHEFVWAVSDGTDTVYKLPADTYVVGGNITVISSERRKLPVATGKPAAALSVSDVLAQMTTVTVSEYITTYGNTVSVDVGDSDLIAADFSAGTVTVQAISGCATGSATVTVSCGDVTIEFNVTVTSAADCVPAAVNDSVIAPTHDVYSGAFTISDVPALFTHTENIDHYALGTADGETIGNSYSKTFDGTYSPDTAVQENIIIYAVFKNDAGSAVCVYTVPVIDSTSCRIANGGFESGLTGWTMSKDGLGAISSAVDYWPANEDDDDGQRPGLLFHKEGSNFFHGSDNKGESNIGTLTSPQFVVGGSGYITFRLGSAGHKNYQYVEVVDVDTNDVLAHYVNTEFVDAGGYVKNSGDRDKVSGMTLILYKADLSAFKGKTVVVRITDNWTAGSIGFVLFDDLVTYYAAESGLPAGANAAVACTVSDKTTLNEKIAEAEALSTADYTAASIEALDAKIAEAKTLAGIAYAYQTEVDAMITELEAAVAGLTPRTPTQNIDGKPTEFTVVKARSFDIDVASYFNDQELSSITYSVTNNNTAILTVTMNGSTATVTAVDQYATSLTIMLNILYKGEVAETVDITVNAIAAYTAPDVNEEAMTASYDLYNVTDNKIVFDLESNLTLNSNPTVKYYAKVDGGEYAAVVDPNSYELIPAGSYGESATTVTLTVKLVYDADTDGITVDPAFTYTLSITDTTAFRLYNGDFELATVSESGDIEGWTKADDQNNGHTIGAVSDAEIYWGENVSFKADGKFFSGYNGVETVTVNEQQKRKAIDNHYEDATGTLTSSEFTVSNSGWITFKIGGAKNPDQVYIEIIGTSHTARFGNYLWGDGGNKSVYAGCTLIPYKVCLKDYGFTTGEVAYIKITDNATADYGLFFVDSFITYYTAEPDYTFQRISPYEILNGSFETGDFRGWTMDTRTWAEDAEEKYKMLGNVVYIDGTSDNEVGRTSYESSEDWYDRNWNDNMDGKHLFTFAPNSNNYEAAKGVLRSSEFTLKANAKISFRFGAAGGTSVNPFVYVQIRKTDGTVLAKFYNDQPGENNRTRLVQYAYAFNNPENYQCYFEVVDMSQGPGYGCFVLDDVRLDLAELPAGAKEANDVKYTLYNGSFENDLTGWNENVTNATEEERMKHLGVIVETDVPPNGVDWYTSNSNAGINVGKFFTFYNGTINYEDAKGDLTSTNFVLKANGSISFKLGAGFDGVFVQVCRASDNEVIGEFVNSNASRVNSLMYYYWYKFDSVTVDTECYIRIVDNLDNAEGRSYRCFVLDDVKVNVESEKPDDALQAENRKSA